MIRGMEYLYSISSSVSMCDDDECGDEISSSGDEDERVES